MTMFDCSINIQQVLKEAPKSELTAEEFQDRCLEYFMDAIGKRNKMQPTDIDSLRLCDLKGEPIVSILDWMQKPSEV